MRTSGRRSRRRTRYPQAEPSPTSLVSATTTSSPHYGERCNFLFVLIVVLSRITRTLYPEPFESFGFAYVRRDGRVCGWFAGYNAEAIEVSVRLCAY